ncbi:hypothetical protein CBR_g50081 [Chara braunii]|uniref:DDE Tnp4 domain-containing protein n=1 Tax=Chara braunii TaxID=69332 RepID=A0A388M625_CHABU|nr:hypothetical protein CBR_g50081 [Chara braunii]|eukprot:GBG89990.1 hypothetical protein CBR_g50081 [Chara braunii]
MEEASGMVIDGGVRGGVLTKGERTAIAAAVNVVLYRCLVERTASKMKVAAGVRRKMRALRISGEGLDLAAVSDAVLQVCYALGSDAFPRASPRWWMKRRTGGTWEDLRQTDDATDDCFRDNPNVATEPLQPDHIVAYTLYRWASGETYDNGTCSFGIGRASGITTVQDVTAALLVAYPDKISWPTGLQKAVVLRAFADKGFPNCHGCIDCTHIYEDKPANANGEDYCDRKRRFSVQAQVVVDSNLRVLDVLVGYPGSVHDMRMLHLSSLWDHAERGELFTGPHVMLPFGVRTNGYLLGDNGYPQSEWIVVPYGGLAQHPAEARFDRRGGRLKGRLED